MYVTDTQTAALPAWYSERRPADWVRGIRVADARTGSVTAFIESSAEFVAADRDGNVYGAEVPGETLVKHGNAREAREGQVARSAAPDWLRRQDPTAAATRPTTPEAPGPRRP